MPSGNESSRFLKLSSSRRGNSLCSRSPQRMRSAFANCRMALPPVCVVLNTTSSSLQKRAVRTSCLRKLPDTLWRSELERYSDRYRPSLASQPVLKRKDFNPAFFPPEIFEDYFNPRRKRKGNSFIGINLSFSLTPRSDKDHLYQETKSRRYDRRER